MRGSEVPIPPGTRLAVAGADIILNLSATDELTGKHDYLVNLIRNQVGEMPLCVCICLGRTRGIIHRSCIQRQRHHSRKRYTSRHPDDIALNPRQYLPTSTSSPLRNDRIHFSSFGDNYDPEQNAQTCREIRIATKENDFELEYRNVAPHPFLDPDPAKLQARCDEISSIQAWGLLQRLRATGCRKAVVGISGGLDSTLALLVTVKAFDMLGIDRKGIIGITMPGFGTTGRTHRKCRDTDGTASESPTWRYR